MHQQADGWQEPEGAMFIADLEELWPKADPKGGRVRSGGLAWFESADNSLQRGSAANRSAGNQHSPESLASLLHDTRNMISAMDLYCDLLEEPGVLAVPFRHYAGELRLVSGTSRRLLERLAGLELAGFAVAGPELAGSDLAKGDARGSSPAVPIRQPVAHNPSLERYNAVPAAASKAGRARVSMTSRQVESLAEEIRANHNLLSALVGPAVTVGVTISGGYRPIAMTGDDLTRVLVNLARNAAEAMPEGGHIQISLEEIGGHLLLTFVDNGPGIPESAVEAVFSAGYSTHVSLEPDFNAWPKRHRGLGLSIVRSLVSAAGGSVRVTNGGLLEDLEVIAATAATDDANRGACFTLEFPMVMPLIY